MIFKKLKNSDDSVVGIIVAVLLKFAFAGFDRIMNTIVKKEW